MKITLIAEGSSKRERATRRWGVAFLVGDVLFDTFGREDIFWRNLRRFQIDLSAIKCVVISHDDWDHVTGLSRLLRVRPQMPVYVCDKAGKALIEQIQSAGGSILKINAAKKISKNIFSLGQMRSDTRRGILYEQALVVKSNKGFSIITGCAHPGIVRIVKKATATFGKKIYAILGGFHMKDNDSLTNQRIVKKLMSLGVKKAAPLHCSGANARRLFRRRCGANMVRFLEGQTIEI